MFIGLQKSPPTETVHQRKRKEDRWEIDILSLKYSHAADIARGREGARDRDDAMSDARYNFNWNRQFELALDGERAREYHDESLPQDVFKDAEFCSMCGPKFCSYRISQELVENVAKAETV